jgi:uncharacterized protein YecT (DUF1311 family)
MKEPQRREDLRSPLQRMNWTTVALVGGLVLLILLIAYFATNRNSEQDKLTSAEVTPSVALTHEKLCSSKSTYALIKSELFRRAAQLRGSDRAAYDRLAGYAVVRMDNPVMESEDSSTGAVNCSGSLALDLPPGVAAAGGRRTLLADVDYTVGASGGVALRNADSIVSSLATLTRVAEPRQTAEAGEVAPEVNVAGSESANVQPGPATSYPGRPSFDCSKAHTQGEIAVCSDSGLSALDLNMATQYRRALAAASPQEQEVLRQTGRRFYVYRDHCPNRQCIADAYVGRMREIRDIMEGRWTPAR